MCVYVYVAGSVESNSVSCDSLDLSAESLSVSSDCLSSPDSQKGAPIPVLSNNAANFNNSPLSPNHHHHHHQQHPGPPQGLPLPGLVSTGGTLHQFNHRVVFSLCFFLSFSPSNDVRAAELVCLFVYVFVHWDVRRLVFCSPMCVCVSLYNRIM